MHDRLCIVRLNINSDFIEDLHPSIELLKATKVINCYGIDEDIQHFEMVDLISKFEIELRQIYDTTNKMLCFPHFVDKSGDKTKINPLFNSFKNISDVNLCSLNNEEVIKTLCDIRDLGLRIDRIFLACNGSENSEKFTNPEFFKNGLNSLDYKFKEIHNLSDVFISNINSLKLSSLSFRLDFKVNDDFDYLKILTHAKNYSYLEFSKCKSSESIDLTFENLPMVIASCLQNSFFIKCRSFMCTIELDKIDKNYWFSKEKPKDCDDAEHTYIHLISSIKYEFKEPLHLSNTSIIKEISNEFSPYLLNCNHKCELIIPMRCLKSVNVKGKQILNFIDNQDLSPLLQEICKATKFNCSFDYHKIIKFYIITMHCIY